MVELNLEKRKGIPEVERLTPERLKKVMVDWAHHTELHEVLGDFAKYEARASAQMSVDFSRMFGIIHVFVIKNAETLLKLGLAAAGGRGSSSGGGIKNQVKAAAKAKRDKPQTNNPGVKPVKAPIKPEAKFNFPNFTPGGGTSA